MDIKNLYLAFSFCKPQIYIKQECISVRCVPYSLPNGGVSVQGVSVWGGVSIQGISVRLCPGGFLSRGFSVQRGLYPGGVSSVLYSSFGELKICATIVRDV